MIANFKKRVNNCRGSVLSIIAVILLLIAAGFLLISNIKLNQKRAKLDEQIAALDQEAKDIRDKNEELKTDLSEINNPDYIEKIAKEQLNLQKQGETVVGFIMPPEEEEQQNVEKPWWDKIWDWIKNRF